MIKFAIDDPGPIGCTYWRQLLPVRHLTAELSRRAGIAIKYGRISGLPDALFLSRFPDPSLIPILIGLKRAGTVLVWDLDDDLLIPERFADDLEAKLKRVAALKLCLSIADVITVSTPHLATRTGYPEKSIVCPNLIDLGDYPLVSERMKAEGERMNESNPIHPSSFSLHPFEAFPERDVVLFAGSPSHHQDLRLVRGLFERTKRRFQWVFYGVEPRWMDHRGLYLPWGSVRDYPRVCRALRPLVCVAPLEPCTFNESKSAIKVWESATFGAHVLASDTGPYRGHPAATVPEGAHFTVDHLEAALDQPVATAQRVAAANSWQFGEGRRAWTAMFDLVQGLCAS